MTYKAELPIGLPIAGHEQRGLSDTFMQRTKAYFESNLHDTARLLPLVHILHQSNHIDKIEPCALAQSDQLINKANHIDHMLSNGVIFKPKPVNEQLPAPP